MFKDITTAIKQLQPELTQIKSLLQTNNELLVKILETLTPFFLTYNKAFSC